MDETYLAARVPEGTRVHRINCRKVNQAKAVEVNASELTVWARPLLKASCCKPNVEAIEEASRQARQGRFDTLAAAKAEAKMLKAWEQAGEQGDRPETPNLDALNAKSEAKANGDAEAAEAHRNGQRTPRELSPRRAAVREAKKQKHGRGKKLTDDEFAAYVAKARREHPEESSSSAREYAYWVDGLAVERERWKAAWAAAEPGQ